MRSVFFAVLIVLAVLPGRAGSAEEKRTAGPLVIISGDTRFSVREPKGWIGDAENAAQIGAAVVLYRENESLRESGPVIAVRISDKVDEDTQADLVNDMEEFSGKYPGAQFSDLPVKHPSYRSFSKVFEIRDSLHEYVCFLNPGRQVKVLFSVAMNTGTRKADGEELQAYREVVRSLRYLPQKGAGRPK